MVGTCRKCSELILTRGVCGDDETGGAAVAVGLEFMQAVRAHWMGAHPRETWQEAEVSGALSMLFPFLAGADVEKKQQAVLLLACAALTDRAHSISFNVLGGVLAPRPAGLAPAAVHPLEQKGRVSVLEDIINTARGAGFGPSIDEWLSLEKTKLRACLQSCEFESEPVG